jgi:hypothetical protein
MKRLTAVAIYEAFVVTIVAEVISYPSVTRYLREAKLATSNPEVSFSESISGHDDCDQAILLALDEQLFAPMRQLARLTYPPRTSVHRRRTQFLGFQVRRLRWVPHRLSKAQKSNQVEHSRALLSVLGTQQGKPWHNAITLDESWFYLNTGHESIWLPPDEKVPEKELHCVRSENLILTNVWNSNGFHVINALS